MLRKETKQVIADAMAEMLHDAAKSMSDKLSGRWEPTHYTIEIDRKGAVEITLVRESSRTDKGPDWMPLDE